MGVFLCVRGRGGGCKFNCYYKLLTFNEIPSIKEPYGSVNKENPKNKVDHIGGLETSSHK